MVTEELLELPSVRFPEPKKKRWQPNLSYEALLFFNRLRDSILSHNPRLPYLLEDAKQLLLESVQIRHVARGVQGLRASLETLPQAKNLAELLKMPEDVVVRVIDPQERIGYRILIHGISDVAQFHVLLSDLISNSQSELALAACRDDLTIRGAIAEARFQFLHPKALHADGSLPSGFSCSGSWFWGHQSLADLPRENGELVVLLTPPAFSTSWEIERKFPAIVPELKLLEVLASNTVDNWLLDRCPEMPREFKLLTRIAA